MVGLGAAQEELLRRLPGTFRYSQARQAGAPESWLRAWLAAGDVERIGHGLYRQRRAQAADLDRLEVASRAPRATICLVSGLVEHDLVDDNPPVVDVALPRGMWRPQVGAAVRWHAFAVETFDVDRDFAVVDSETSIGVYGPRRCIVDVFRLRHEVGPEVGVEALRRWLRRRGNSPALLLDIARRFPAAMPSLTATLQVLA